MLAKDIYKQILIVDRDQEIVGPLSQKLSESGFAVQSVMEGTAALSAVVARPPHLVILDWNMPGFAGLAVLQNLRKIKSAHAVRLIILSALSTEQDVITALDLGADDYIVKPFSLREVVARVSGLLRTHPSIRHGTVFSCDDLIVDTGSNRVTARGKLVNLSGVEFRMLQFLMTHLGKTFSRSQLMHQVWGGVDEVDARTIDVNVQRLRKVLGGCGYEDYLQTVRGFGYRFSPPSKLTDQAEPFL